MILGNALFFLSITLKIRMPLCATQLKTTNTREKLILSAKMKIDFLVLLFTIIKIKLQILDVGVFEHALFENLCHDEK